MVVYGAMSMRSFASMLLLLVIALGASGCAKNFFYASAPAKTGWVYVVGAKNDRGQAWLCPDKPGTGKCHEIEVEEVSK